MFEEASIFNCEDRVHHHIGNVSKTQNLALATLRRQIVRQYLRLQRERLERDAIAAQFRNRISSEQHTDNIRLLAPRWSRLDVDLRFANHKTSAPHLARVRFNVAGTSQSGDEFVAREPLTGLEYTRSCVKTRSAREVTGRESYVDDL